MPSLSKDQQEHCQVAQLCEALFRRHRYKEAIADDLLNLNDVNVKVLANKSHKHPLVNTSLLHIAFFYENVEVFGNLLERGIDFTAKNINGRTALHEAFYAKFPMLDLYVKSFDIDYVNLVLDAHVKTGNSENPSTNEGLSHFHIACAANHTEAVHLFLNNGVSKDQSLNMDSRNFAGFTPMHFATRFCAYATVKLLLEQGMDLQVKDAKNWTPLHTVTDSYLELSDVKNLKCCMDLNNTIKYMNECEKIIRLLLEHNTLIDNDSMGFRKFHAACTLSDWSLAERFLRDVDINCAVNVDSSLTPGYTGLHFAVYFNMKVVNFLLENGADIEAEDERKTTPLDLCIKYYNSEDLCYILSQVPGLDDILFSDNKTKLLDFIHATRSLSALESFFQTTPRDVFLPLNSPLWPGYCLLHLLVRFSEVSGVYSIAKSFLSFGNSVMTQDARGRTPLHLAFYQSKYEKKLKFVDMLFYHQLGVTDVIDNQGLSYLHIACRAKNESAVRNLLSQGADANAVYAEVKWTPLHFSLSRVNVEITKMLLSYGANVNLTDAEGRTPIHQFACRSKFFDIEFKDPKDTQPLGDLLFLSRDLENAIDSKNGLSHLHVACWTGNQEAVKSLLQLGADPNAVITCIYNSMYCYPGFTPMHFCLNKERTKIIELLVQAGGDIFFKKPSGMTLLYEVLTLHTLEWVRIDMETKKFFMSLLASDVVLQKRAKSDCGLTLLHVVCHLKDFDQIEDLLTDSNVDVNAQMHANSPIWPKATPLHLLIESYRTTDAVQPMNLLLQYGADVTIQNYKDDTLIHKIWSRCGPGSAACIFNILRLLLQYHKDFTKNPVNRAGVSHFHLACFVGEHVIVEKFLKNDIDVNLPIDHLNFEVTFQTPLRITLESLCDEEACFKTIDVLLKYGADIHSQDERGLTPLFEVALEKKISRLLFVHKLRKAGADINWVNMNGKSLLEMFLDSNKSITHDELQFFVNECNLFNTFNSVSKIGIISMMALKKKIFYDWDRKLILDRIIEVPSLFAIDQMGRTPIHNIVSSDKTNLSSKEYVNYIEKFVNMGYDVDTQDFEGKVALHLAGYFCNEKALTALLIAGANINIADNNDRTALSVFLESYHQRYENSGTHVIGNKIELHEIALLLCDLEVNSYDLKLLECNRSKDKFRHYCEGVLTELEKTKYVKIGSGSLTLRDFLSECGAVASRPFMVSQYDREAIDKFFESIDIDCFPYLMTILKLQYRKAMMRLQLMYPSMESLKCLIGSINGFHIPEICCRVILRYLTNTEIKYLISSTFTEKIV